MIETAIIVFCVIGIFWVIGFAISIFEKITRLIYRMAEAVPAKASSEVKKAKKELESLVSQFQANPEEKSAENKVAESPQPEPTIKPMVELVEDDRLGSEEATEMLTIRIGNKAIVMARYYSGSRTVARHLVFSDEKLRKRLGKRMAMSPLKVNGDWLHAKHEVIRSTRSEVNEMIADYVKKGQQDIKRQVPKSDTAIKGPETESPSASSNPNETQLEVPADADARARKLAKGIMKGVLQWHGLADRVQGEKSFKHYRLDYIDDETKLLETVWGEDLKRAVTSCNAKKGDLIEIFKLGRKPVDSDKDKDEKRFMNRYHILVLKKASGT